MTDLSPDFDFTAATNAAIEAAAAPEEAVETPETSEVAAEQPEAEAETVEATDDRPRNPDGTFAAKDPEPDVTEELEALRKRLADKDEFISRQGNELGDLRKAFEERFDTLEARTKQPAQRVTADLIDNDPGTATRLAWQQDDRVALSAAFTAWKDEDPAAAGAWAAYTAAEQKMAEQAARYDAQIAALEQKVQPIQQATLDQQSAARVRSIAGKYGADTISAFVQSEAFQELAEEFPWAQEALSKDAAGTIESLFLVHRGRTADTLNRTQEQVARETAEQAAQATNDAFVASASTATATTAEQKTEAELIAEGMAARIMQRDAVWKDGWERH